VLELEDELLLFTRLAYDIANHSVRDFRYTVNSDHHRSKSIVDQVIVGTRVFLSDLDDFLKDCPMNI